MANLIKKEHRKKVKRRSNGPRKAIFAEEGYETLIVWEHEMKNSGKLNKKLLQFVGEVNG